MNEYLKHTFYCIFLIISACELPDRKLCEKEISASLSVHIYQEQTLEDANVIYYCFIDNWADERTEKIIIASSLDELDNCDEITAECVGNLCYITLFDSRDVSSIYDISCGRHTHIWPGDSAQRNLNDSLIRELLELKPHLRWRC